ncbi:SAM-dependent methyltransferase [Acidiphilium sp. PA]|uniref:tRNA1(Val) (adenine(37)-N6)-methyltransferase n=1 Tax=Acidiphilium sp. PA TaxID=2871705 RepID=UPI0022448A0F|nr:SAM-dependent methyltransferase [Acidiphilium sp. PA]MCW8307431.1 SAM-dependent methyltransferase [Acidiphilium sp. PA]
MTYTAGTLLGGKLQYRQTARGHRSGLEPVLLAAMIPARAGQRVIEAGTGAGAGLLCLGYRVSGLEGIGIERDPGLAALAADNFRINAMTALHAVAADVIRLPISQPFDHAFANPPWRSLLDTPSPDAGRRTAHRAGGGLLADWAAALGTVVRFHGTLTFILPAGSIDQCLVAMTRAGFGACRIVPFWPRRGRAAKLVIIQSKKQARGPVTLQPGLILHDDNGFTPGAEAILRDGAGLSDHFSD